MAILIKPPRRLKKVKSDGAQRVLDKLEEFLKNDTIDNFAEILCRFWKDQQTAITYKELREAVINGYISTETLELWSQDYSYLVNNSLNEILVNAMKKGAYSQSLVESASAKGFVFDTQSPGVFTWLNEHGAEFVTSCTQQQKDAISSLISYKMIEGHTVDELSRMIRPCIGLTEGQAKANARYYDNIVASLKKDHPRMSKDSIRKKALDAAAKYAERQHRERAYTIARTECAFAYNRGADEGIRQAQSENYIGTIKKKWSTSGDDRVCDICAGLEGIELDMDADFPIKGRMLFSGHHMLPPAHPRCACAVEYIETEPPVFQQDIAGGLGSGAENNGNVPEHDPPEYLGSLDDISEDVIHSTLEKYEAEIVNSDIEQAVVISSSGLVWRCYGDKDNVYPNVDLGDILQGAWVTHNHPAGKTHFSFSYDDISLFMEYSLKELSGIDELYRYTIRRTEQTQYVDVSILEHAYKAENYSDFMELLRDGLADPVLDEYDFHVRRLAEQYGFKYRRDKR